MIYEEKRNRKIQEKPLSWGQVGMTPASTAQGGTKGPELHTLCFQGSPRNHSALGRRGTPWGNW